MADLKRNKPTNAEEEPVMVREADHYKIMREFCDDPVGFVEAAIEE